MNRLLERHINHFCIERDPRPECIKIHQGKVKKYYREKKGRKNTRNSTNQCIEIHILDNAQ